MPVLKLRTLLTIFAGTVGSLSICSCSSFWGGVNADVREANNNFSYVDAQSTERPLVQPAGTDPIVYSDRFKVSKPVTDARAVLIGRDVDIRPPQKIISLNNNVEVFQDGDLAQVWFYPQENGTKVTANDLLYTLFHLFRKLGLEVDQLDVANSMVKTDWFEGTEFVHPYNLEDSSNGVIRYRQRYVFRLLRNSEGAPGVVVQLVDNEMQEADGTELADGLTRFEPARFSALMANRLLETYYDEVMIASNKGRNAELSVELGRDNNGLPCWLLDISFADTYKLLQNLLIAYDIDIKEYSSSDGEILVDYDELDPEFWQQQDVEPWGLVSEKYKFKIGVVGDKVSISLYDKNDAPVPAGVIARMYSGFASSLNKQFLRDKRNSSTKK